MFLIILQHYAVACHCCVCFGCHLEMLALRNLYRLPRREAEDGIESSGIGGGKSIGLAEAVDSNRSRSKVEIKRR